MDIGCLNAVGTRRAAVVVLGVVAGVVSGSPASSQDRFGSAVAVAGSEIVVVKPGADQGPATVFLFRRTGDGGWAIGQALHPPVPLVGEGFGPSVATAGGRLVVAGGDPDGRRGAYRFRRSTGEWVPDGEVALPPVRGAGAAGSVDLASVMRILQPPARVVVTDGHHAVVARAAPAGSQAVRAVSLGSDATGDVRLRVGGLRRRDGFGRSVALVGRYALVGAPGYRGRGAVFVFVLGPGTTVRDSVAVLTADDLPEGAGFGTAIGVDGETLMVSAPGSDRGPGMVVEYQMAPSGSWEATRRATVTTPGVTGGDRFGAALALTDDQLWVGVPGAEAGAGRVDRFVRDATGGWVAGGTVLPPPEAGRAGLGKSVALGAGLAAVGAPGADGGRGRVAVFEREAGGWGPAQWLRGAPELETLTGGMVGCEDGRAGGFACQDVDLLAFLSIPALGGEPGERVSDLWGWTDPLTGREYALVGRTAGAAFVDITDPAAPRYLGLLAANPSGARDLKVYRDHLFLTGDGAGEHGLLIFDLTRLRGVADPPVRFDADVRYDGIASAHNLVIDTAAGFAYPVGASGGGTTCGGGLHMVDIRDPERPLFAGCYTDTEGLIWPGRTHDAQCVVYHGPDPDHAGREICFASNETALRIVDVTDKDHPTPISAATYPGLAYVHQGWLTEDQRYFYLDDELDELVGMAPRTRTLIWDVADLDDPVLAGEYLGPNGATDHNLFIKGTRAYQANYQAGLRVLDITDPERPTEVGFFDTTPYEGDAAGFSGAWTAFPFFRSGTVIVSSINEGLFLLRPRPPVLVP